MSSYAKMLTMYQDLAALEAASGLMNWDRQVLMPTGGGRARTNHVIQLSKLRHELLISDELASAVETSESESEVQAANLRNLKNEIDHATKIPYSLIERKARASSDAYDQWRISRAASVFGPMIPYYEELFAIARETAEALGYSDHPYDALIDMYEEGSTHAEAESTLGALKEPTIALVKQIKESGTPIEDSFLYREWDQPKLRNLMQKVISQIGFRFDEGRLDLSANAFCTHQGVADVRMTTRPSDHIRGVVSSSLHEMGHALYEQNQRLEWDRTPICGGISLAVHESQSRTWENVIGRSFEFWSFFWPWFQSEFPELSGYTPEQFWKAYNNVAPGNIRVGSDELHYNLHILIRFELESEIITGKLAIKDLPAAWNAKYSEYLGITPESDAVGCLQDVHWARGSIGYFPTYSFGNLIGVQIWDKLQSEIPNTQDQMARGDFSEILGWLTTNLYQKGKLLPPKPLLQSIVGQGMSAEPWLNYATTKFKGIYELA